MSADQPTSESPHVQRGNHFVQCLVRPRPGQVWAFGGTGGRRDTIKRVSRGMVGAWRLDKGRLIPIARATAMWVQWESRMATITVTHLWENWVCIGLNDKLSGGDETR